MSLALTYLRSINEVKISVLIAVYESTGVARIFKIDVAFRFPQPCTSLVLGSGKEAARGVLDPKMALMRRVMSPEDAKPLAMDSLIAASVDYPHTGGDALRVYQMTEKDGFSLVLTGGVLEGYKDRITHLNLEPENDNRVLFLLTESERFVPERSLTNFFRDERVSKCINLGRAPNGRVIYRLVFEHAKDAAAAYKRSCYEYELDVRKSIKRGDPNSYKPFSVPLERLLVQVRWVYVLSVHFRLLVCYLQPIQEQLRMITDVPVQYWPTGDQ